MKKPQWMIEIPYKVYKKWLNRKEKETLIMSLQEFAEWLKSKNKDDGHK
jgi:hypothetical protein